MDRLIVACVQERMRVFARLEDYRHELQRFLRIAQYKHASLVIFSRIGRHNAGAAVIAGFPVGIVKT